jgi:hypothetical protein
MGLFSSIIHVRASDLGVVCDALKECVQEWGYSAGVAFAPSGPPRDPRDETLLYLISPLLGDWTTIIESHFAVKEAPWLAELALRLSGFLNTYLLAIMVHDDDVLYYNLSLNGEDLDGYNSCPQYFERERLTDALIIEQRHECSPFVPILPANVPISRLESILNRGWWAAYLDGRLDADGVISGDEPNYSFEGERMIAIGNSLQLHGSNSGYPFADWFSQTSIDWRRFLAVKCAWR